MTSSVDRLFENEGDVFISSNYGDFNQALPSIQETASVQSKSPEPGTGSAASAAASIAASKQLAEQAAGRESPSTTPSTAKSSRRDSLTDRVVLVPSQTQLPTAVGGVTLPPAHLGLPAHAPPLRFPPGAASAAQPSAGQAPLVGPQKTVMHPMQTDSDGIVGAGNR